jgi:hypothetical protein
MSSATSPSTVVATKVLVLLPIRMCPSVDGGLPQHAGAGAADPLAVLVVDPQLDAGEPQVDDVLERSPQGGSVLLDGVVPELARCEILVRHGEAPYGVSEASTLTKRHVACR